MADRRPLASNPPCQSRVLSSTTSKKSSRLSMARSTKAKVAASALSAAHKSTSQPIISHTEDPKHAARSYTGAPFFAAITALRMGADLSHVICAPSAADAIKSYAPDLIVHPILRPPSPAYREVVESELSSLLSRLHVLVIGPGLGREDYMIAHAKKALYLAKEKGMYVLLDADALWMLGQDTRILRGYRRAIITPNVVEFKRLSNELVRLPRSPSTFSRVSSSPTRALAHRHLRNLVHYWSRKLSEVSRSSKKARKTSLPPTSKAFPQK